MTGIGFDVFSPKSYLNRFVFCFFLIILYFCCLEGCNLSCGFAVVTLGLDDLAHWFSKLGHVTVPNLTEIGF